MPSMHGSGSCVCSRQKDGRPFPLHWRIRRTSPLGHEQINDLLASEGEFKQSAASKTEENEKKHEIRIVKGSGSKGAAIVEVTNMSSGIYINVCVYMYLYLAYRECAECARV